VDWWDVVPAFPHSVLADISILFLSYSPFVRVYVVEIDIFAWVSDIAANGVWVEQAVVYLYIFDCDIAHSDSGFCLANSFSKGIKHASWSISIRLFHLLGTDIDAPPNWSIHCEVFKV
jgi:hypothetical protein